jgi:hypothetical protein
MEAAMSENNGKVGYKNPPLATRFKPGQSGNPSGRPKRRKTLHDEVFDVLEEPTRIVVGESQVEVSNARAIAKALVGKAVDGNMRAMTLLESFVRKSDVVQQDEVSAEDLEILNDHRARQEKSSHNQGAVTDSNPQFDTHQIGDENGDKN